jgi:hypothetical protein
VAVYSLGVGSSGMESRGGGSFDPRTYASTVSKAGLPTARSDLWTAAARGSEPRRPGDRRPRGPGRLAAVLALALLASVIGASTGVSADVSGPNPPLGIHLSYLGNPTQAAVTWHTASASTSRVEWGTTRGPPYANAATGNDFTSPGGTFLHSVTLAGLTPGTLYFYRAGDATMTSWSGQWTFRAALAEGSTGTFTFAAAGDFSNVSASAAVASGIAARAPNLFVGLGDYYYSPNDATVRGVYEKFETFARGSFLQLGMGNHEHGAPGEVIYTPRETHCAFVNLPGNERSYSFTYGNTFFLSIDWGRLPEDTTDGVDDSGASCGGVAGTAAIRAWADAQLAAADADPDVTWKVVSEHFLCYNPADSMHYWLCPGTGNPDQMEDIMVNRGVDLVLQAHDHIYARTHPVRFSSTLQTGTLYDTPGGPIYLVLGTGGFEPRMEPCRTDAWVAACRAPIQTSGFGHFTVSPTTISYQFVENSAGIVDTFTLHKTPTGTFALSVTPTSASLMTSQSFSASVMVRGVYPNVVALSTAGCPSGVTCTFSLGSGNPTFTSTLTIATGPSVAPGTYPMTVTASDGTVSRSVDFTLTVGTGQTVTFQRGDGGLYSETDDTFIFAGAPTTNYGTNETLQVDGGGCVDLSQVPQEVCRSLIKFPAFLGPNPGQVPPGATILNATLAVTLLSTGFDHDVYRVTEGWTETGATWNSFATPGFPANQGLVLSYDPGPIGRFTFPVTSIVQNWANGDVNEGILTASANEDGALYQSSESTNPPTLTVTFTAPGGPPPSFDFTLSVSPTSATVAPGDSATASVTATLTSGTPSSVSFSALGLPAGASASFAPSQCVPTCTTTMTVATSGTTPTGTHPITVTAVGGGVQRTTTFTLVVSTGGPPPSFDFDLSISPSSGTASPGDSLTASVTAALTSGTPDPVSFAAFGLPPGATASFSPFECVPTCTSTMTLTTSTGTPTGTFDIAIAASDGGIQRSTTFTLIVEDFGVPPPSFDFDLSVDPSSGTVVPGESTSAFVTATLTSGTPSSVFFEAFGLPLGATASFDPPDCVPSCDTEMTVTTSTITPTGTFDIAITASDGEVQRSTTFSLVVSDSGGAPPPFDFDMVVDRDSETVAPGDSATVWITVILTAGDPDFVFFSAFGLPPEAAEFFDPSECLPSCESALTIETSTETPTGAFDIEVIASGGGIERSAFFTLVVEGGIFTLSFQRGDGGLYSETDDAYIHSGDPFANFGDDMFLYVDADECLPVGSEVSVCRTLIMFPDFIGPDPGQVPMDATILSAFLEIDVTDPGGTQHLYQVTEAWDESTVTWMSFFPPGEPQTTGEFDAFEVPTTGTLTRDVTSFVDNWVSGFPNFGWFITSESSDGADFSSSECEIRPKLTVTFRPPSGADFAPPQGPDVDGALLDSAREGDGPNGPHGDVANLPGIGLGAIAMLAVLPPGGTRESSTGRAAIPARTRRESSRRAGETALVSSVGFIFEILDTLLLRGHRGGPAPPWPAVESSEERRASLLFGGSNPPIGDGVPGASTSSSTGVVR